MQERNFGSHKLIQRLFKINLYLLRLSLYLWQHPLNDIILILIYRHVIQPEPLLQILKIWRLNLFNPP